MPWNISCTGTETWQGEQLFSLCVYVCVHAYAHTYICALDRGKMMGFDCLQSAWYCQGIYGSLVVPALCRSGLTVLCSSLKCYVLQWAPHLKGVLPTMACLAEREWAGQAFNNILRRIVKIEDIFPKRIQNLEKRALIKHLKDSYMKEWFTFFCNSTGLNYGQYV